MFLSRSFYTFIAMSVLTMPTFAADPTQSSPPASQVPQALSSTVPSRPKVDLNKATAKELLKVRGINPFRAKAIVNYRKKHGNFTSFSELHAVKGFKKLKPEKLNAIQNQITID